MAALVEALNAEYRTTLTESALRNRYRRWRASNGAPALADILARPGETEPVLDHLLGCLQWGTSLERQAVEALQAKGNIAEAAESLGMTPRLLRGMLSELQRRAAKRGWSPADSMTKTVPEGFHVKGVSTLYDADGNIRGQWVKSKADAQHALESLAAAVQVLSEPFKGLAKPARKPAKCDDDLLCVYPMGDPHLGMYAWHAEAGEDFDLNIATRDLIAAADHLVDLAPPAAEALILPLGDFFHSDNSNAQTTRGTRVDVDTRWSKVLQAGVLTMRHVIDRALLKHKRVTVRIEIGNHDGDTSIMLALCLANFYEKDPRVTVDTSPAKFWYYRFGNCLIGTTHSDSVKLAELPSIMAHDRALDWGETEHRGWYCGHVHHESVKEYRGCTVETFRTLATRDAWHSASGYRSGQDMRLDVFHRQHGRINRHIVGIRQVRTKVGAA